MLNWGFANYSSITPQIDKKLIADVNIVMGEERKITPQIPPAMSVLIPKGRENDIVQNVELVAEVEAPVESNQTLGTVTVSLDGEVLGKYNLTSPHYVDRLSFKTVFCRLLAVLCNK